MICPHVLVNVSVAELFFCLLVVQIIMNKYFATYLCLLVGLIAGSVNHLFMLLGLFAEELLVICRSVLLFACGIDHLLTC